jgi:hypothetical protein
MGLCGAAGRRDVRLAMAPVRCADGSARPGRAKLPWRRLAGPPRGSGCGWRTVGFNLGSGCRCRERHPGWQHRTAATHRCGLWLCPAGSRQRLWLRLQRRLWLRWWLWLLRSVPDGVRVRLLLRPWLRHVLQPKCRKLLLTSIGRAIPHGLGIAAGITRTGQDTSRGSIAI